MERAINTNTNTITIFNSGALGLRPVFAMTGARRERFHYRGMDKRVIDFTVQDNARWTRLGGPCVYCVFDAAGVLRYVGKHQATTPLRARWIRRDHLHHQETSRNCYLSHFDGGAGMLTVCSITALEIWEGMPATRSETSQVGVAVALEALWIDRHFPSLWNGRREPLVQGFSDRLSSFRLSM